MSVEDRESWLARMRTVALAAVVTAAVGSWLAPLPLYAKELKAEEVIRTHSCMGCHIIPGIPEAVGRIGPSLKGLSDRPRIAGGTLANTPENLRRWLRDPKNVKMTLMPNTGLTELEIDVLIKFLVTL